MASTATAMAAPAEDGDSDAADRVIGRARLMLRMAELGLEDLTDPGAIDRQMYGLYGLAVYGRSITFILQNLRAASADRFDEWYGPKREEMKADGLMKYFVHLRNEILKEGRPIVMEIVYLHNEENPAGSTNDPRFINHLGSDDLFVELVEASLHDKPFTEWGESYLDYLRTLIQEAETMFVT